MPVDGGQVGWKFWRRWALASSVAWFAGLLLGFVAASASEPVLGIDPLQGMLAYFILGVCPGAGVGVAQWLVLRKLSFLDLPSPVVGDGLGSIATAEPERERGRNGNAAQGETKRHADDVVG